MKNKRLQNILLNTALVAAGVVFVVLAYSWINQTVSPRVDPERGSNVTGLLGDVIQAEVLNGCGVDGVAGEVRTFLADRGFDVVESGNYETFEEAYSRVIDRTGEIEHARKIARLLGIPESRVTQQPMPDRFLDVTLIIGKDYDTLTPFGDTE